MKTIVFRQRGYLIEPKKLHHLIISMQQIKNLIVSLNLVVFGQTKEAVKL